MSLLMNVSPWESWHPAKYFEDYFGQLVAPDEQAAIRFQVEFLQRQKSKFKHALEYGCGPTLMRAIAAAPYVESMDMADWMEDNLRQIYRWADEQPDADDWSLFTEYALSCEGSDMLSRRTIAAREQLARDKLSELIQTDAKNRYPLGKERVAKYDLLISGFCLDCLSPSKAVWLQCMKNVFSTLKPEGSFLIMALRNCKGYLVGEHWFPGSDINRADLESALLACGANPETLHVSECDVPDHANQGYQGILMASGELLAVNLPKVDSPVLFA